MDRAPGPGRVSSGYAAPRYPSGEGCGPRSCRATRWLDQWADAVTRLQLPANALPAEAEAGVVDLGFDRDYSTNRSQTMRRLDGLRKDLQQFRSDVLSLHASLGAMAADLDTTDPEKAVRMLYEQLRDDMLQTEKLAELARRIEKARNTHTDA